MDLFSTTTHALTFEGLSATAALFTGLASSAHCALMCGPLAATAGAPSSDERLHQIGRNGRGRATAYHLGRIGAYAAAGTALGAAGEGARHLFTGVAPVLPWVMAGALVATALGAGKRLPVPAALKRLAQPVFRKAASLAPLARSAAIGAATPLLPCGIVYGLFIAAAAAGAPLAGAAVMAAFAVGATPALALIQAHAPVLSRFPRALSVVRRALPLLAAVVLVWRAVHSGGGDAPPTCH